MARGRLEGREREREEEGKERKRKKKRCTDADGQCRLVYQNGIVGAIIALLDTPFVGYIQAARAWDYSILSFIHSPRLFSFFFSRSYAA